MKEYLSGVVKNVGYKSVELKMTAGGDTMYLKGYKDHIVGGAVQTFVSENAVLTREVSAADIWSAFKLGELVTMTITKEIDNSKSGTRAKSYEVQVNGKSYYLDPTPSVVSYGDAVPFILRDGELYLLCGLDAKLGYKIYGGNAEEVKSSAGTYEDGVTTALRELDEESSRFKLDRDHICVHQFTHVMNHTGGVHDHRYGTRLEEVHNDIVQDSKDTVYKLMMKGLREGEESKTLSEKVEKVIEASSRGVLTAVHRGTVLFSLWIPKTDAEGLPGQTHVKSNASAAKNNSKKPQVPDNDSADVVLIHQGYFTKYFMELTSRFWIASHVSTVLTGLTFYLQMTSINLKPNLVQSRPKSESSKETHSLNRTLTVRADVSPPNDKRIIFHNVLNPFLARNIANNIHSIDPQLDIMVHNYDLVILCEFPLFVADNEVSKHPALAINYVKTRYGTSYNYESVFKTDPPMRDRSGIKPVADDLLGTNQKPYTVDGLVVISKHDIVDVKKYSMKDYLANDMKEGMGHVFMIFKSQGVCYLVLHSKSGAMDLGRTSARALELRKVYAESYASALREYISIANESLAAEQRSRIPGITPEGLFVQTRAKSITKVVIIGDFNEDITQTGGFLDIMKVPEARTSLAYVPHSQRVNIPRGKEDKVSSDAGLTDFAVFLEVDSSGNLVPDKHPGRVLHDSTYYSIVKNKLSDHCPLPIRVNTIHELVSRPDL